MFRADRFQSLLDDSGLSQSELARRVGVSQATIWKLLKEPAQGSKHIHKIAFELSTTPAYLMDETDDPTSEVADTRFSSDEMQWVSRMRALPPKTQAAVYHIIDALTENSAPPAGTTLHSPKLGYRAS